MIGGSIAFARGTVKRRLVTRIRSLYAIPRLSLVLVLGIAVGSCTAFDPLDQTGETINRNATDYANNAILLNVIRASLSEPLTFVTITGLDGTDLVSGSLGLPTITFGPHPVTTFRDYAVGPNALSRSNQNTFHISVVDDPASYAALLAPLNPAMIGFFIRQGYPRELLFFLFVDRMREVILDKNGDVAQVVQQWFNDPSLNTIEGFGGFVNEMPNLLRDGLTAEIDVTAIPSGHALPLSKLCFDTTSQQPGFVIKNDKAAMAKVTDNCETEDWIQAQGGASAGSSNAGASSPNGTANAGTMVAPAADDTLWVVLGSQNKVVRVTRDAAGNLHVSPAEDLTPPPPKKPKAGPYVAYLVHLKSNGTDRYFQLFMRSTYGVYNYVGALLHYNTDVDNLLVQDESGSGRLENILTGGSAGPKGCFADVDYRDLEYCVPNTAGHTKQLFTLLHELQQLNTAPSNSPTTLTVVPTPGP